MPIRGSPNGANHLRPQAGRDRLEQVVAINRNAWSQSIGTAGRKSSGARTVFRPGLWRALVDPTQVELVVLNLAINARDASQVGGSITLETANATVGPPEKPEEPQPGQYVTISVTDAGSGMTKDVLAKAFEPFFTTKEIGKGSGLGLSQVLGFAKQSGGGMRIETRVVEKARR